MISDARRAANRRNGRLSKGPRSREGKAISRRNAIKHGLGTGICGDRVWSCEVARLARALEAHLEGAVTMEQAAEIAAEMVALIRLTAARTQVWNLALCNAEPAAAGTQNSTMEQDRDDEPDLDLRTLSEIIQRLATMERYERQARRSWWRKVAALNELGI